MLIRRGGKVDQLTWHGDWGTKKKDGTRDKKGRTRSRGYTSRALPNMVQDPSEGQMTMQAHSTGKGGSGSLA
jgi:hypothetical protein